MSLRQRGIKWVEWLACAGLMGVAGPVQAEDADPVARFAFSARKPIALLYISPSGERPLASQSEVIASIEDLLKVHTDLEREEVKDAERCQGELHCFALAARADYDRKAMKDASGVQRPYREHLQDLERKKQKWAHHLLVITYFSHSEGSEEKDRISALLVDTDVALEIYNSANDAKEFWKEDVEARVNSEAVVARSSEQTVGGLREAKDFLEKMFADFRPELERAGNWEPFGSIELSSRFAGLELSLDGKVVGTTKVGLLRIDEVPQGSHHLVLSSPGFEPYDSEITVERGAVARLSPDLHPTGGTADISRQATIWTGAATMAGGVVTTILAATKNSNDLEVWCFGSTECGGSRWVTRSFNSEPQGREDPNQGGVALAPLGFSLIGAGATWTLGSLFFTDEGDFPWIPIVAGVALGGLTYGIAVAVDGDNPFPE